MESPFCFPSMVKYWASTLCQTCGRGASTSPHEQNLQMCWSGPHCHICARGVASETIATPTDAHPIEIIMLHTVRHLLVEWLASGCYSCHRRENPTLRKNTQEPFPINLFFDALFGKYCCVCGLGNTSRQRQQHPQITSQNTHNPNRKRFSR